MPGPRDYSSGGGNSTRPLSDGGILQLVRPASEGAPESDGHPRRERLSVHRVYHVGGVPADDRGDAERGRTGRSGRIGDVQFLPTRRRL